MSRFLNMPFLQSVSIEAVAYDEGAHLLKAKFRGDGRVVIYENVPEEVYDSLIFAESVGRFFRDEIEGHYAAHEVQSGNRHH